MPHILKNELITVQIDLPQEQYQGSRFDWTGKITAVTYQNKSVTGIERTDLEESQHCGKGFYNEFGIDQPLGFEETVIGDWFHKIGVGLLKKDSHSYDFQKAYEVQPAAFKIDSHPTKINIGCTSAIHNGIGYFLHKTIALLDSGFMIHYRLTNTGDKTIETNEYCHNFLAIDQELMGAHYHLKFPFQLQPHLFGETVNPEQKVTLGAKDFSFTGTPQDQFFFSNLSGSKAVTAQWELFNLKTKIGIRETGSFPTSSINLWGWTHVISPELFHSISLPAGQTTEWSRTYEVFTTT
ncbi:hypothetical protein [Sediminicola sp. 1XM1-17]|uniref:hypothetical protein n=1 Tax=Sediminicola sp. 1XM1-17 TaxID=3127702 RepID=UPI00307787C1